MKLRTKTGCFACRNRRKKCDEGRPVCQRCATSGRECQWPTSEELTDRRNLPRHLRRTTSRSPTLSNSQPEDNSDGAAPHQLVKTERIPRPDEAKINFLSARTSHQIIARDIETAVAGHFVEKYYDLILLPDCNPKFRTWWITEIQNLMVPCKSLQYSVLACAASHLHFIDPSPQSKMQELSLKYYSQALGGLARILAGASSLENHDGLLMTVMLLYLHGCVGVGTYSDIPKHINAAMRILRIRLLDQKLRISQLFDRLAIESVLYHMFQVAMDCWLDSFVEIDYHFDAEFWDQAETLLTRSTLFPHRSVSYNSPILGIPFPLFRLALDMKQLCESPERRDPQTMGRIRLELEGWEVAVLSRRDLDCLPPDEVPTHNHELYNDCAYLYILIASMLMEQLTENKLYAGPPQAVPKDKWQLVKAVQILRKNENDGDWTRCFIGNWAVYTLGYFMSSPKHIELVRHDLDRRWELTKFAQIYRFLRDLEAIWSRRGYQDDAPAIMMIKGTKSLMI